MVHVARLWWVAVATAIVMVVAGLTLPDSAPAAAASAAPSVAPALVSQPTSVDEPVVPEGEFANPGPKSPAPSNTSVETDAQPTGRGGPSRPLAKLLDENKIPLGFG